MKRAIIYARVNSNDQTENQYNLLDQEERLRQYCNDNFIDIVGFYKEKCSAKTFDRPVFNQLLVFIEKNQGNIDLLLFLRWDRFSRDAGDACIMVNRLNELGVQPQGIEQPAGIFSSADKVLQGFTHTAPEKKNNRRSVNIIYKYLRALNKELRKV